MNKTTNKTHDEHINANLDKQCMCTLHPTIKVKQELTAFVEMPNQHELQTEKH